MVKMDEIYTGIHSKRHFFFQLSSFECYLIFKFVYYIVTILKF